MKVRLLEIDDTPTQFKFQITRDQLLNLDQRFNFDSLECRAYLARNLEFVELKGHYQVNVKSECDFCLDPVFLELDEEFTLDLVSEGNQPELSGDVELSVDSPEMDYYSGEEILLIKYFEDQLILDLPLNASCSDDCKGLCSSCGANLNHKQCDCHEKTGNSPFSVLKDLKPGS